jgi:hypothetical protein
MLITSDALYKRLKFFTQVLLPAIGTLYFTLAGIWGLPAAEEVVGTIVAIDTFLGVVLHLSTNAYNNSDVKYDGDLNTMEIDGVKTFSLELGINPDDIAKKDEILFKVKKESDA